MKLHASGEDYLETILVLQKKRGMVRSVDVARHMEVSKPSVCHAVATLRDGGFLMMDEDHFLHLTDVGREVAEKIYERHCFFTEQLITAGVDPKTAEADDCRIEHIISNESFDRLKEAVEQEQDYDVHRQLCEVEVGVDACRCRDAGVVQHLPHHGHGKLVGAHVVVGQIARHINENLVNGVGVDIRRGHIFEVGLVDLGRNVQIPLHPGRRNDVVQP